jgi:hypothetical protein
MALFKVNTGTREQEVVGLRWDWEVPIPELKTSVFVVPGGGVKNGEDRLVVMNAELIDALEKVSWSGSSAPTLTLIKSENSRKSPAIGRRESRRTV